MRRFLAWLRVAFFAGAGVASLAVGGVLTYALIGMPNYRAIDTYSPAVASRVFGSDGELIGEFAREDRIYVALSAIPDHVIAAFLAAEDSDFYRHSGVDWQGVARALLANVTNVAEGRRLEGASTITQQVAENILLGVANPNASTFERLTGKLRETILAVRIDQRLSKDRILELYLNQIFLGQRAYGVAAAAQNYFNAPLDQLTLAQAAYFGALPKAPNNYHPTRRKERAIERRNWVLDRMAVNGFITQAQADEAKGDDLVIVPRASVQTYAAAGDFVEEVRRAVNARFGEDAVYQRGFSIRTTLDTRLQTAARTALRAALERYDRPRGWRGALGNIGAGDGWAERITAQRISPDDPSWRVAAVLSAGDGPARIGFADGAVSALGSADSAWASRGEKPLTAGDLVFVRWGEEGGWRLQQIPEVNGGMAVMEVETGRVLALIGGYSWRESSFNRATQARRQPGSAIKPIVYAAALERGLTPDSVFSDQRVRVGSWSPDNYDSRFYGNMTLRQGLILSRNTVTVRIAQRIGIRRIVDYARRLGVYDQVEPSLALTLGANETTVLRLTAAYAAMANGGRYNPPSLVDRVQGQQGETVYRPDVRWCLECEQDFQRGPPPPLRRSGRQVLDPTTAWDMVQIMEAVVTSGTGRVISSVGKPIAGKTGTTNDFRDAWFVGFSPHIAAGVYVGYDTPRSLGVGNSGGVLAAPIMRDFFQVALEDRPAEPFSPGPEMRRLVERRAEMARRDALIEGRARAIEAAERGDAALADQVAQAAMDLFRPEPGPGAVSASEPPPAGGAAAPAPTDGPDGEGAPLP